MPRSDHFAKRRLRFIVGLLFMQAVVHRAGAQALAPDGGTNRSAWFSYFGDQPFAGPWALHLEGSYRRTLGLSQFEQLELRPGLTFMETRRLESLVAYTFFRSETTGEGIFGPFPLLGKQRENRLLEQQQVTHKLFGEGEAAAEMTHRFRLEQRWLANSVAGNGFADRTFRQRARYRLTLKIPFRIRECSKHYWIAYNETYTNTTLKKDSSLMNQDVTYVALGSKISQHWAIETGYQFRYSPTPLGVTGPQDHSLQVYLLSTAPFRRRKP